MSQLLFCRLYINFTSVYSELSPLISWQSPSEGEVLFTIPFNPLLSLCLLPSLFFLLSSLSLTGHPHNIPPVTSSASSHWDCLSESVHFEMAQVHLLRHMFSFSSQGGILTSIFYTASSIQRKLSSSDTQTLKSSVFLGRRVIPHTDRFYKHY